MDKRQSASDETRTRILEAARQQLAEHASPDLSMDAIARRADVSRLTIYYQFESRRGLLESLYDYLAMRGQMFRMADVFHEPDPERALDALVRTFVGFWSTDPVVMRRIRAMAALDADIEQGVRAREARRVHASREILKRMRGGREAKPDSAEDLAAADVISTLTSFETYDALARAGHSNDEIVATIADLARRASARQPERTRRSRAKRKRR